MGTWIRRHRLVMAAGSVTVVGLVALAAFTLAGGFDETVTARAGGEGPQVVEVSLVDRAVGFDVTPDVIEVEAGTHLVLEVVNEGAGRHDLALPGGLRTEVLAAGESQRLEVGRVTDDRTGRCTIGDHDVAGMTVELRVT